MHIVTLSAPINTPRWKLAAGRWLCEDLSAFELGIDAERGTSTLENFEAHSGASFGEGDRVLLVANGGFGDLVMLTPALRKFRAMYPNVKLALSCRKRTHCVLENLPYAPELLDYPLSAAWVERGFSDHVLTFEHLQESSEEGRTVSAIDIKARVLRVGPLTGDERRAEYIVTPEERHLAHAKYGRNSRKRIGIQLQASSPTRTYHPIRASEVMVKLFDLGYELYVFGSPSSLPKEAIPPAIRSRTRNLSAESLSFRESAALLTTCDCVWAPDSSLMHLAGAMGIPCVAIFGSTHWQQRTADYPSVIAIQSMGPCGPCWNHPKGHQIWVKGAPCETVHHCQILNNIPPDQIVEKIQKQLAVAPALTL